MLHFLLGCVSVCVTVLAFLLVRRPKTVEYFAQKIGSLNWSVYTTFAVTFGLLAAIDLFARDWLSAATFGSIAGIYGLCALRAKEAPQQTSETT